MVPHFKIYINMWPIFLLDDNLFVMLFTSTISNSHCCGTLEIQKGTSENARSSGYDPAVDEITTGTKVKLTHKAINKSRIRFDLKTFSH